MAWYGGSIVNSPLVGTIVAETGLFKAGPHRGYIVATAIGGDFILEFQRRNALNTDTLQSLLIPVLNTLVTFLLPASARCNLNERFRLSVYQTAIADLTASIFMEGEE